MYKTFIESLVNGSSLPEVCDVCKAVCRYYGFERYSYSTKIPVSLVAPRYLVIEDATDSRRAFIADQSPMQMSGQCVRTGAPIRWYGDLPSAESAMPSYTLGEPAGPAYQGGVSMLIHSHHAGSAVVNYHNQRPAPATADEVSRIIPELYLLAAYKHEAISRFINYDKYGVSIHKVSPRERECLTWSAEGITTSEIAKKLGISNSTVTFHIQNVMRKLSASNRQQAIAKAIMLGII